MLWNDYYSFQLRVPQVVTLTYNLSVEVKQVDVDALNGTILETIYPDSDDQTTGKSVGLQTGQECLFADIVYNSNVTHDYMFLEVNVEPRLDAGIGITVSLLLIFNPRRAQRGLVGLSVSLSVYLSVTTLSATTRNETTKERYQKYDGCLGQTISCLSVCLWCHCVCVFYDVFCHHVHAQFAEVCW